MPSKKYDPKEIEEKWQKFWEKNKTYAFNPNKTDNIYSIDTPPPTVSGKMHMGHAFGYSQFDFIARFKRMQGHNVLMPIGTDDNGLPTQLLIQKLKKVRAKDLGHKAFRKLCRTTIINELRPKYLNDFRKLGISYDWDINYSTIDLHCQKVSQKSFIELYKKGKEYRIEAPMMICPKCKTAISQVELEDADLESQLVYIKVKVETGDELVFATTRPELLPACMGISVHPDDKRYKHLIGKKVNLPLINRQVVLSADKETDPEYGSGVVYYCSYGGMECIEWLTRHPKTKPIHIMGVEGVYNGKAGKYEGMDSNKARKEIINDLDNVGALVKTEKIRHAVNVHERCGTEIEYVATKQWFIKFLDLKEKMLKWGNKLNWFPLHMKNRYDNWAKGLKWDWCISRQIPFGIPFPVWYCEDCDEIILAKEKDLPVDPTIDKPPVDKCPKCGSKKIIPEKDIINTWATSSLTPTIVKELFKGKKCYKYLTENPMNLRPQGHDIISFWLFNTVVKSQLHFNMLPWNDCFIHGWMLDPKGKKMSKSKGNVIEPQPMLEKYSADALRFMSAGCKLGDDLPFQEKDLVTGKKFANKLWNASNFVFMHLEKYKGEKVKLSLMDKWLLSKLNGLIKTSTEAYEKYDFMRNKLDTEKFFWQNFCDNYLEIVKYKLYNLEDSSMEKKAVKYCLNITLKSVLKLMAPIMPYVTEELYQEGFKEKKSIHLSSWPVYDKKLIDKDVEKLGDIVINIISAVRKFKSQNQMSLKEELSLLEIKADEELKKKLNPALNDLKNTLKLKEIKFSDKATIDLGEIKINIKK